MTDANKEMTIVFEGIVTAEAPLATNPPGTPDVPVPGRKHGIKAMPTFVVNSGGANSVETAYFPSSGFKGKLRHRAAARIHDAIKNGPAYKGQEGGVWSIQTFLHNTLGGVKEKGPEEKEAILQAAQRRRSNPLVSLFGAGDVWTRGRVAPTNLIPTDGTMPISVQPVVIGGVRSDPIAREHSTLRLLSASEQIAWVAQSSSNADRSRDERELKSLMKSRAKAKDDAGRAAIDEKIAGIQKGLENRDGPSVSVGQPLPGFQALPQGTKLHSRIVLRGVNWAELGLFLAAMDTFGQDPVLGAHINTGCGLVSAFWQARLIVPRGVAQTLGTITIEPFAGIQIDASSADHKELLVDALDSWIAAEALGLANFDFSPDLSGGAKVVEEAA